MRIKSFLFSSLRLEGIKAIIRSCESGPLTFSDLFMSSNIRFKPSFLNYLNYCKKQEFVIRTGKKHSEILYRITPIGRQFLDLVT